MRIHFATALLCCAWLTSCQSVPKSNNYDVVARPGGCPEGPPCPTNKDGSKNEESDKEERRIALVEPTQVPKLICSSAKATIAIADFETKVSYNRQAKFALSEKLGEKLLKTGCFQLVDRQRTRQIFEELGVAQSGVAQADTAVRFGRLIGVDLLVLGNVTHFSLNTNKDLDSRIEETARIESTISMVDIQRGIIVASETVSGEGTKPRTGNSAFSTLLGRGRRAEDNALEKMLDDAVSALVAGIPEN